MHTHRQTESQTGRHKRVGTQTNEQSERKKEKEKRQKYVSTNPQVQGSKHTDREGKRL